MENSEPNFCEADCSAGATGAQRWLAGIACSVLGIFVIYVLSVGPAAGLTVRHRSPSMGSPHCLEVIYGPLVTASEKMPGPIRQAYYKYVEWWMETLN
jgi:hypothetical protein